MSRADWPVELDGVTGCWLWSGRVSDSGYPWIYTKAGMRDAHRVVYLAEVGAIPKGMELEHACKRRHCVAPAHLWLVTRQENVILSGRRGWRTRTKRKDCPKGHDLWLNGTRTKEGGIVCRVCSGIAGKA